MGPFVQIPSILICHIKELTKTEIIVLIYLFSARNQRSGQCNPRRKTIAKNTGIAHSHVSAAVKGLTEKKWIAESPTGSFELIENIVETLTSESLECTDSVNSDGLNPSSAVTDSVMIGYGIGNEHIKEYEQTKEQINKPRSEQVRATMFADDPANGLTLAALATDLPVIEAFTIVTKRTPPKECWGYLSAKLGDRVDVARLRECYEHWLARGYNRTNYDGIADWYLGGIREGGANRQSFQEQRAERAVQTVERREQFRRDIAAAEAPTDRNLLETRLLDG